MQSQRFIRNSFKDLYTDSGADNKRPDLRARESILGEYIKEQDFNLKTVADGNLLEEERFRRMSWYDFNCHIDWLRKRRETQEVVDNF
jgi:hypothetical protein